MTVERATLASLRGSAPGLGEETMIRYVLIAALLVALVALTVPGLEYAAATNSERYGMTAVTNLENGAQALLTEEELPPIGQPPPQRIHHLDLPPDSMVGQPLALEIERLDDERSLVRTATGGGEPRTTVLEVPFAGADGSDLVLELEGTGERTVRMTLERNEADEPKIRVEKL